MKLSFSLTDSDDALRTPAIRQSWGELVEALTNLNALYASPEWCESKFGKDAHRRSCVAILSDPSERIVGLAPVEAGRYALPFGFSERLLWRIPLRAAKILGSLPMLPDERAAYDCFLGGIFRAMGDIDCVHMECVDVDSFASRILLEGGRPYGEFAVYSPKKIQRQIKDSKLKVQAALQDKQVRVTGKSRDDLQDAIALEKKGEYELPLQFTNFRD